MKQKALFLDRDGVINHEKEYVYKIADFQFIDGVFDVCAQYKAAGFKIIVVTNQSGIGRGYYSEADFQKLTVWMNQQFAQNFIDIDGVYFCPHHPTDALPPYQKICQCRKPKPGMLLQAIEEHDIDPQQSIMFGDKEADIEAAIAADIGHKVLVRSGHAVSDSAVKIADKVVDSLTFINEFTHC
ncbi:D-glycero-beta-D-manno-heptose 1,7-bisphosphate 7-phosphatase [Flocculibacter collagenilyticus]|uniref:D-glycero-beta-D-manno-heptose 1,7-bisphosphate 7-phosphatase n=1 Tax=Flocculibacter collagenilyticus TaxID=2744479 RepID=UPI0018F49F7A|nr:D-glycero-beta-D-manno-heptose 1,7-bisphosphate 7-phosphatase [Flocculibacter collagenilyticus]